MKKGWTFGGQAAAAARDGVHGDSLEGAFQVAPGMWMYRVSTKGLAAELGINGTRFTVDKSSPSPIIFKEAPYERNRELTLHPVAWYQGDLKEKFGLPRQSGWYPSLPARLLWLRGSAGRRPSGAGRLFPPMAALGLFLRTIPGPPWCGRPGWAAIPGWGLATRSPFRPNPLGLSLVEIREIRLEGPQGPEIWVAGADLLDGTPIYDLKPYVPYADARPEARSGFAPAADAQLTVEDPQGLLEALPQTQQEALRGVWPRIPGPITKRTRSGSTVCSLTGGNGSSEWTEIPSVEKLEE